MTQDEIIEMARQVGIRGPVIEFHKNELEAFAKLMEDKVTERYMQLFLDPENQPTQFGTATEQYREQEINDETEMCSEIVLEKIKEYGELHFAHLRFVLNDIYFKIKARGEA